jgi:uncharacterized membrane protein (DUF441 family)
MNGLVKSKTILGIVLTALISLLPQFGISFTADDSAMITGAWDAVIQALTLGFAFYGRVVAKGPLGKS